MENPHVNCGDKKPQDLRPTNLNPLYKIKLHRFTWLFYPKDLLFSTYNLIHVDNVTTFNCSSGLLQPRWNDEGLQTKIQRFNPWMRYQEWCGTLSFLSRRSSLKNERSLYNLSPTSNPQGVKSEVFIGKNLKSFSFGRVLSHICVKDLGRICMIAWANLVIAWVPRVLEQYGSLEWSHFVSKVDFKTF